MYGYFYHGYDSGPLAWLFPFVILELVLKGIALWKAGRNNQKNWFIAILLINSIGLLPAAYLIWFQSKKK